MEFNFSPLRLSLFALLIAVFWWFGGFSIPLRDDSNFLDPQRIAKAWRYCVLLFLIGAGSVSIVDHYVGNLGRMNIRLLYIVLGTILMLGSYLWLKGLQESTSHKIVERIVRAPSNLSS